MVRVYIYITASFFFLGAIFGRKKKGRKGEDVEWKGSFAFFPPSLDQYLINHPICCGCM